MIINNMLLKLKKHDEAALNQAREVLLSMRGKIEYLRDIQVYKDLSRGPVSYDLLVIAKYNSLPDFEAYKVHPVHVEVGKYIGGVVESVAAVCYEA